MTWLQLLFSDVNLHWQRPTKYLRQVAGASRVSSDIGVWLVLRRCYAYGPWITLWHCLQWIWTLSQVCHNGLLSFLQNKYYGTVWTFLLIDWFLVIELLIACSTDAGIGAHINSICKLRSALHWWSGISCSIEPCESSECCGVGVSHCFLCLCYCWKRVRYTPVFQN